MKKILFPVLISLLLGAAIAGAQPYENSTVVGQVADRIVITMKPDVQLAVQKAAGTPMVGVPAMDALAQRFAVHTMDQMYAGETSNLSRETQDYFNRIWAIDFPADMDIKEVKAAYEGLPQVEKVQLVDICKMYDAYLPDDPGLSSQWYLRNMNFGGDVRALGAWSESLGDSNVVICILDSGMDWHHPDLGGTHPDKVNGAIKTNWTEYYGTPGVDDDGNGKIDDIRGWDFVHMAPSEGWPDEDVSIADNDPMDYGSHGTQCGGMAAAITNNGIGISGVAPGCKILPVRCGWMPNGSNQGLVRMDFVLSGMLYAVNNGADIINCSWGSTSYIESGVQTAIANGVIVVTAAGNDDSSGDVNLGVPSFLSTYSGVIAVAATDASDTKSSFSNYGSWVELSAPGSGIYTTTYLVSSDTHTYSAVSGTSFSSPITCGAAALVWSANPGLTAGEVRALLYSSADDIDALNPGYAGLMGAGRVNLLKALGDNQQRFPQEFPTLYDAINSAAANDTVAVLGTAVITGGVTVPAKSLQVLGGYSADYTSRDPVGNRAQITGLLNNNTLKFIGAVDNTTVIDGFVISGGGGLTFSGIPYSGKYGGGVMLNGTSPTLRNLEITGNTVGDDFQLGCGGGLMMTNSTAILENVYIHDNAGTYGAGLFAFESTPTLIDCVIENNTPIVTNITYPPIGGGIHALDSDLTMTDCTITGHLEAVEGGGVYLTGFNTNSTLNMTGGEISGNSAKNLGGGLYIADGSLTMTGVLLDGNTKTATSSFMRGGGIFATTATVVLDSLTCLNNHSMAGGAMELASNIDASVTNSLLANNTADFWGAGMAFASNTAGNISGNTITGNSSAATGGAGIHFTSSNTTITNNISAMNTGGATYANGMALLTAPASLSCNDVYGNDLANYSGEADPTGTNGNISVDPLFCNPGTGNYAITTSSPCAAANSGGCGIIGAFASGCGESAVPEDGAGVPMVFQVDQNFPNPFNPKTTIQFALPKAGRTQINIFDIAGRHVRTLLDEELPANTHQVTWTGENDKGQNVAAGVYFYLVISGDQRSVGRMALIK